MEPVEVDSPPNRQDSLRLVPTWPNPQVALIKLKTTKPHNCSVKKSNLEGKLGHVG